MTPVHAFVFYLAAVWLLKVIESVAGAADPFLGPATWAISAPTTALVYLPALYVAINATRWMRTGERCAGRWRTASVVVLIVCIELLAISHAEWIGVVSVQVALAGLFVATSAASSSTFARSESALVGSHRRRIGLGIGAALVPLALVAWYLGKNRNAYDELAAFAVLRRTSTADAVAKSLASGPQTIRSAHDLPSGYAQVVLDALVTRDEWLAAGLPSARPQRPEASLLSYAGRGSLLSVQENFDLDTVEPCMVDLLLEDLHGCRLRHKIVVGTDLAKCRRVVKESNYPAPSPFRRAYLLVSEARRSRAVIVAAYEGAFLEIDVPGHFDAAALHGLEDLTHRVVQRLEAIYPSLLKPICEGPTFADNPPIERPDLPDPDQE
jgi:hypothetical protein